MNQCMNKMRLVSKARRVHQRGSLKAGMTTCKTSSQVGVGRNDRTTVAAGHVHTAAP
jgi:hypothetical protein